MDFAQMLDWFAGLTTLTALELVLGIDNIVLLTILVERLPEAERPKVRRIGLTLAMLFRLGLLTTLAWLSRLTTPLFTVAAVDLSTRDLILILGGLFLLYKATTEIYHLVEVHESLTDVLESKASSRSRRLHVLGQIIIFDLIFSLDSVLTAVGLAKELFIMVAAVVLSAVLMIVFANAIGRFVSENPSIKMLALSFLVMIGVLLVAEGFGSHFNRGYIYSAMAFSLGVEVLNQRRSRKAKSTPPGGG